MACRRGKLPLWVLGVTTFACAQEGGHEYQRTQKIASWMMCVKNLFSPKQVCSDPEELHKRARRVLQRLGPDGPDVSLEEQAARSFPALQTLIVHTLADMIHQEGPNGSTWKKIRDTGPEQFVHAIVRTHFALFFRDERYRRLGNRGWSLYQIPWTAVDAWRAGLLKIPDDGVLTIEYTPLTPCEGILLIPGIQRVRKLCLQGSPESRLELLTKFREMRFAFLLPLEIGYLANLRQLIVKGASTNQLPTTVGKLEKLRVLDLLGTDIPDLPVEIGKLRNLRWFRLNGKYCRCGFGNNFRLGEDYCDRCGFYLKQARLTTLPDSMGQLVNLKTFILRGTKVKELPRSLRNLRKLQKLDLSGSWIEQLPAYIGQFKDLQILKLSHSLVGELPDALGQLENLLFLGLEDTRIQELPESVSQLRMLRKLKLRASPINKIPDTIEQLHENLELLDVRDTFLSQKKILRLKELLPTTRI